MRRAAIVLGLASSAVAAALVALVYGIDSRQSPSIVEPTAEEASQAPRASSIDTAVGDSTGAIGPQRSVGGDQNATVTESDSDTGYVPPPSFVDEETSRKMVREEATREVPELYSLLLEHLDLTPSANDALLSFLTEIRIAATYTSYSRGKTIDPQERSDKIAAIIGDAKRQEFLALERNIGSYAEVVYMESVFEKHDLPMSEAERGRVLEILIYIQERKLALPGADAERGSIEYFEYRLAKMDERERLVFEQAASVLSTEQVGYLFEQYQRDSYRRADALERQKKARADDNAENLPLSYPGRSYPDTPQ